MPFGPLLYRATPNADRIRGGVIRGEMFVNPPRHRAARRDPGDPPTRSVESVNRRRTGRSRFRITEPADHVDLIPHERCGMKIGRGKIGFGITIDFEATATIKEDDIVVDPEVGVVMVFVFATDLDVAAIRKLGQ